MQLNLRIHDKKIDIKVERRFAWTQFYDASLVEVKFNSF